MLMRAIRRVYVFPALIILALFYLHNYLTPGAFNYDQSIHTFTRPPPKEGKFQWSERQEHYPVSSMISMPQGKPIKIPKIQHNFPVKSKLSEGRQKQINERRMVVKGTFERGWQGYRNHAWMKDELMPISGGNRNHFGGWAATLIDSLDTLWIMGLKTEFEEAVLALDNIDFTTTEEEELNVFETTIRYIGGLLAAHDLSDGKYPSLLEKAVELGDLLYGAFDTPNRMPVTRWHWKKARAGEKQEAGGGAILAELGSFTLEFTRLSQLSGDPKFFDAAQRISDMFEQQQSLTKLPGMWPVMVNAKEGNCSRDTGFTLGAMADSTYEYLPKHYMLLGGLSQQPRKMYEAAIDVAKEHNFFRPMTQGNKDILISAFVRATSPSTVKINPEVQHLVCFVGGMMGLASRIFERDKDLAVARKLVDGCIWSHDIIPVGIMAETFYVVPCENATKCEWDEKKWHDGIVSRHDNVTNENLSQKIKELRLEPGITHFSNRRYILRPEAIESIFILYRITGDESLRDTAWRMFEAIDRYTKTEHGNAALGDVTISPPSKSDSMESFWTAETLKYFYLIFSEPDLISLDEYVFSTEAHPFKRPH